MTFKIKLFVYTVLLLALLTVTQGFFFCFGMVFIFIIIFRDDIAHGDFL